MGRVTSGALFVLLAITLLAGVSQAATIYEKDGFTYKVKGDWQIQLRQDPGVDQDLDLEYDDLEIKNAISYELNEDLTAFGGLDFGFNKAADKSDAGERAHLEEAYVGMSYQDVRLTVGKTCGAADEFGVEEAYEVIVAEDAFDEAGSNNGDDLIKVEAKFGNVTVVASHELAATSEASDENGKFTDVFVGTEIAGIELGAAYQRYEAFGALDDTQIYGVSLSYDAEVVTVAADYSVAKDDQTVLNVAVAVPVNETTKIAAGYVSQDFDSSLVEDAAGWYANATYKFHKNVRVFAEIEGDDKDQSDMGYMAGLQLKF